MEDGAAKLPLVAGPGGTAAEVSAAVTRLHLAADFLASPFFTAQVIEAMRAATVRGLSPWLTRGDAAAYVGCSTSEIDRAAKRRVFKTYLRMGTPLFRREELDEALLNHRWTQMDTDQQKRVQR